jgi:hypothetical protein
MKTGWKIITDSLMRRSSAFSLIFLSAPLLGLVADQSPAAPGPKFPAPYSDYQIADASPSPNGKFAVILRDITNGDDNPDEPSKNYFVALSPFHVLARLPTNACFIERTRQGGLGVNWAKDSSAVILVQEGKFGPEKIYVLNLVDGTIAKKTDLYGAMHQAVLPDFKKAGADAFNDNFDFFIDNDNAWTFNDSNRIVIDCEFTNDPRLSARVSWTGHLTGIWDAKQSKFIEQHFTRTSGH